MNGLPRVAPDNPDGSGYLPDKNAGSVYMLDLLKVSPLDMNKADFMNVGTQMLVWMTTTGLRVLVIIVVSIVLVRVLAKVSSRLIGRLKREKDIEAVKRIDTLESVVNFVIIILVGIVGSLMVLSALDIDISPLLATAGIAGVAIGFGSQQLVQDIISGFFILMEDQIRVGDVVEIAGKGGLVERINLRMTVLRDLSGNVHFVRNGMIDVITNMTKDYSRYVFNIGVAYRENVDRVIEVIREVDEDLRADANFSPHILEPIEILGLDQFADSAVIIKARTKTAPIQQWTVGREFNRRLKKRFDELGIEIPFPHQTIYFGEDKTGNAPPMRVRVEKAEPGSASGGA